MIGWEIPPAVRSAGDRFPAKCGSLSPAITASVTSVSGREGYTCAVFTRPSYLAKSQGAARIHKGELIVQARVFRFAFAVAVFTAPIATAQQAKPPSEPAALTIYNDNFAVVRTTVELKLAPGMNDVTTTQVTTQLEPDSVVLRNPSSHGATFRILEQNYDSAVVTQEWLLQKFEGKTIDFQLVPAQTAVSAAGTPVLLPAQTVKGKIIRAGQPGSQPLVEVDDELRFQLPGTPLFPASTDGLLLKPTLHWQIESDKAQSFGAELAFVTGGFSWQATYNVIAPETTDVTGEQRADVLGWVTINNQSGSDFPAARIKLMAGDVAKIQPQGRAAGRNQMVFASAMSTGLDQAQVTQKAFDDFHLYDLNRTVELHDREIKQVQFLDAPGVTLSRSYLYDGAQEDRQPLTSYSNNVALQQNYGLSGNTKVHVLQEFKNSLTNHLGIPLPSGRLRLYRRDSDGQIEFVGESLIPHTPTEDTVKIVTGNAFDVKGSRTQSDFHVNQSGHTLDETFQIKLTNQKPQPVTVIVVEHLYRCDNWEITDKSADYTKIDSHTIQFPIEVPAKGESKLTYSVRYSW